MTILTLDRKELEKRIGKITKELENKIAMFGLAVEEIDEEKISIDVTANRPDLLSFEGFCRAFSSFLDKKNKLNEYKAKPPQEYYKVIIEKSVKKVRPYTACAIVKNLKFDDKKIKEIIDIQEKLHLSYGRNRKKLAIGIYPLENIKLPIRFIAKDPKEIKFQPLDYPIELSAIEILNKHPTGKEYAHLLKDSKVYPIFIDSNNEILSMPPIINSHKTGKVTESTQEVFIECSGFNFEYLKKTLNIIVCALADMGGEIYSMEIIDIDKKIISPDLSYKKLPFSIDFINKVLGLELKEKEIIKYLSKMNIGCIKEKENLIALIPPYRVDILHQIDLAEEVAIAYGYENFEPQSSNIFTIGSEDKISVLKRKISEILIGLGLIEISTFHLSTKDRQFKNIGLKESKNEIIEVIDSKTENNILRTSLFAQSIWVLSENIDSSYPQKIFEIGRVFYNDENSETTIGEKEKLCITICHEKANFTEIKQILDYLTRMFEKKYEIKEKEHPTFINGRCGEIIIDKKEVGIIGEVSPSVLRNNKIKMPTAILEIDIECFL